MNLLRQYLSDLFGLSEVMGLVQAIRFVGLSATNLPDILRARNLTIVDKAMGPGPYRVKPRHASGTRSISLEAPNIVAGIREIWVRHCYLGPGILSIERDDDIVDLGANVGAFSLYAASMAPFGRVVGLEMQEDLVEIARSQIAVNALGSRVQVVHGAVAPGTGLVASLRQENPNSWCAPSISIDDFMIQQNLAKIDFLKVHTEGSDFGLFDPEEKHGLDFLDATRKISMEVHQNYGDVDGIKGALTGRGYQVQIVPSHRSGGCTLYANR